MLCCAVLCCAVLCCAVLCCAVLCIPSDLYFYNPKHSCLPVDGSDVIHYQLLFLGCLGTSGVNRQDRPLTPTMAQAAQLSTLAARRHRLEHAQKEAW